VLDIWRAVACLLVFTYHTGFNLRHPPLALIGCSGVHLFFVLSGYLIFKPFLKAMTAAKPLPSIPRFYARRFLRIYPPFAAALIVFMLMRLLTHTHPPPVSDVLLRLSLAFNYAKGAAFFAINPVFWSLAVEAQFYILLPLACWLCLLFIPRNGARAALAVVLLFLVVGVLSRAAEIASTTSDDAVRFRSVTSFLDMFAFGMLVALADHRWRRHLTAPLAAILALAGLLLFITANDLMAVNGDWLSGPGTGFHLFFPDLVCAGAALALLAVLRARLNPQTPWVAATSWIGRVSYSLYLYHVGIQFLIFRLVPLNSFTYNAKSILYSLIAIGPALLVSWVMFLLVEKPSLRLAATFHDRPPAPNPLIPNRLPFTRPSPPAPELVP
jgi:peptidoglycan/LPS O-acetylase OafA/YrhL